MFAQMTSPEAHSQEVEEFFQDMATEAQVEMMEDAEACGEGETPSEE